MMTRRELETLLGMKLTDEQWAENQRVFAEAKDKMWDEDHPIDE